jgi:hypothetical protein
LTDKAYGEASPGLRGKLRELWTGAKSFLSAEEDKAAASREITDHVNTMMSDARDLADEAKGVLKREHLKGSVSKLEPDMVAQHASDTIGSMRSTLRDMGSKADVYGQERLLTRMDSELGRIEKRIVEAAEKGDNAEQYALLDDAKRAIGSWTRDVKATSLRTSTDPIGLRQARATYDKLDEMYGGLQKNLENPEVWGKAAINQRRINEAWTRQIAADRQFKQTLAAITGEEKFGGRIYAADPAKVARYVEGLINPDKDLIHKTITDYVSATKDLTGEIGRAFDLSPGQAAKVDRASNAAEAFSKTIEDTKDKIAAVNRFKAGMQGEGTAGPAAAAAAGSFIVGAAVPGLGHAAGAAMGAAANVLMRPHNTMLKLAKLAETAAKFDAKMGGAVGRFFKQGAKEIPETTGKMVVKEGAKEARAALYAKRASTLAKDTYESVISKMSAHVATLQDEAPKTAAALAQTTGRAHEFLTGKLPQTPQPGIDGKEYPPSASQQAKFMRYADAVEDPQAVLEHFAAGRITPEEVEAMRAVYPQIWDSLRNTVMDNLTQDYVADDEARLTYQQTLTLGIMFDMPAALGQDKDSMAHAQASLTQPPMQPPKPRGGGQGKPLPQSSATKSRADQLEGAAH